MGALKVYACIILLATSLSVSHATDPSMLQDFCVTHNDPKNELFINGRFCKNPINVTADDFLYQGFDVPRDTANTFGFGVLLVNANNLTGLNTLGVSIGRIDFAPDGVVPPHSHARASEVFIVMEGTIYVGFVNFQNKLYSKTLNKGDVFVFPQGLIHFHHNVGKTSALAISAFSGQNPGISYAPNSIFGTTPSISVDTLSKSFQLKAKIVEDLQSTFTPPPS